LRETPPRCVVAPLRETPPRCVVAPLRETPPRCVKDHPTVKQRK